MKKTLFELEIKRAFIPFLVILLAVLGGLFVIDQAAIHYQKGPSNREDIINGLLLAICIGLAFPFGTRAFSREFKDNQLLFVHSLPLSRGWTWLVLVSANFLASVTSVLIVLVLRPSAVTMLLRADGPPIIVLVIAYFVLFSAGCCFSLIFGRVFLVYIAGFIFTLASAVEMALLSMYSASDPAGLIPHFFVLAPPRGPDAPFAFFAAVLLVLLDLCLSLWFFVEGEFNLTKVQVKNWSRLLVSTLVLFAALSIALNAGAFALFDRWTLSLGGRSPQVSPDGKYLYVVETLENHPQFGRLNVIDVKTGNLLRRIRFRGIRSQFLSSGGNAVTLILGEDSPLIRLGFLLPPSDRVVSLSPEARQRFSRRFLFSRIWEGASEEGDKNLFVVQRGDSGKVLSMDERTEDIRELSSGDLEGWPGIFPIGGELLVYFGNNLVPSKIWRVRGGEASELKWAPRSVKESGGTIVVNGTAYHSTEAGLAEVSKLYPFPRSPKDAGEARRQGAYVVGTQPTSSGYQWWRWIIYLDESAWMFYIEADPDSHTGKLFVYNQRNRAWTPLAEGIPLNPYDLQRVSQGLIGLYFTSVRCNLVDGLVAYYVEKEGAYRFFLYDANIDKVMELATVDKKGAPVRVGRLEMRHLEGGRGVLVNFFWQRDRGSADISFKYVPKSGVLTKVKSGAQNPHDLLYMDDDGNQIFGRSEFGAYRISKIIYLGADQKERQLWPLPEK